MEVGHLDEATFEKVHQTEQSVQLGRLNILRADLQDLCETLAKVLLRDEAIEVFVEALEGLLHGQFLVDNPPLNLVDRLLLPVKIVFDLGFAQVLKSEDVEELLVGDEPGLVLIHQRVDLLLDGDTEWHELC